MILEKTRTTLARFVPHVKREFLVLLGLVILVAATWAFVEIADFVTEGDSQTFDEWAVKGLRQHENPAEPIGPHMLKIAALDITALGGTTVLTLLIFGVLIYLFLARRRQALLIVAVAALGGQVISSILKASFGRARPSVVPHLAEVQTSSFPSGHSMMSAVVYLTLGVLLMELARQKREKVFFLGMAIFLSIAVGLSRLYLGVHYPTDVLAGWLAGLAWATSCWMVAHILRRRGKLRDELEGMADTE